MALHTIVGYIDTWFGSNGGVHDDSEDEYEEEGFVPLRQDLLINKNKELTKEELKILKGMARRLGKIE